MASCSLQEGPANGAAGLLTRAGQHSACSWGGPHTPRSGRGLPRPRPAFRLEATLSVFFKEHQPECCTLFCESLLNKVKIGWAIHDTLTVWGCAVGS